MAESPWLIDRLPADVRRPTYLSIPPRIGTYGDEAADLSAMYGRPLDPEQMIAVDAFLSYGPGGQSAALEGCDIKVRQNGKTGGDMTSVAMYRVFLGPPDRLIWTAHLFKTCREAFDDHLSLITNCDELRKRVKKVRQANGEEGIELTNGARLDYMARSKGGGRGLGAGTLIVDEALFVSGETMAAVFPTMSARPDPLILYGSSPGVPESKFLRGLRDRGRAGGDLSLAYVEHCAPGSFLDPSCELGVRCSHLPGDPESAGCALDNPEFQMLANPAMPRRISARYVAGERRTLDWRIYARERMGWWDDPIDAETDRMLDLQAWTARADLRSLPGEGEPIAVAFDTSPKMESGSVALAAFRDDGGIHLELIRVAPGTGWIGAYLFGTGSAGGLIDRIGVDGVLMMPTESNLATLATMDDDQQSMVAVMPRSEVPAASALFERLMSAVTVTGRVLSVRSSLDPGVVDDQPDTLLLSHLDDPVLFAGLKALRKRPIGDGGWVPSRSNSFADISGPCAAIAAVSHLMSAEQPMDPKAVRL